MRAERAGALLVVTEAAHWFGYAETRTAATASMAYVLWHSCARVASDSSGKRAKAHWPEPT